MEKKFELTDKVATFNGAVIHRIRALKDFADVKKGDLGGWIEKEENLSQEGNCWIDDNARVSGDAKVFDDAWVFGDAQGLATPPLNVPDNYNIASKTVFDLLGTSLRVLNAIAGGADVS